MYLVTVGRFDEAIALCQRAMELEPLSNFLPQHLAWVYRYAGRGDETIRLCRRILKEEPDYFDAHLMIAWGYLEEGMYPEAIAAMDSAVTFASNPNTEAMYLFTGKIYGRAGATEKAQAALDSLLALSEREYVSPGHIAIVHSALGNTDEMFAVLEEAYEARSGTMTWLLADFGQYRDDPRWIDLARRVGFPEEYLK